MSKADWQRNLKEKAKAEEKPRSIPGLCVEARRPSRKGIGCRVRSEG